MNYLKSNKILAFLIALSILTIVVLSYHSVDKSLTKDDREYIPKFLVNLPEISKESSYKDEIDFISSVQKSTFEIVPNAGSIPPNQKREPKQVYLAKVAGCQDRSRLLEKILIYSGFKTRHISIYSKEKINSSLIVLLTPKVQSHAVLEVMTKKGWMIVDSNYPWIAIDSNNNPISLKQIRHSLDHSQLINWKESPPDIIYQSSFIHLYGVYSRHGRFYPPYNVIPDINYGEFIQNVF